MRRLLILLSILMLLAACHAKTDSPQENTDAATEQAPVETGNESAPNADKPAPATDDNAPKPPVATNTAPEQPKEVVPLVTFIELGAESCIPCRMMQPIMKEIQAEYQGLVNVIFYDLYKVQGAAQEYNVRVMPTQVFLDHDGREFFRHEGFYPKAEIERMLAEKIGLNKPNGN